MMAGGMHMVQIPLLTHRLHYPIGLHPQKHWFELFKKKKKLKQGAILSMGSWAVAQAAHSCIQPCLEVFLFFLVFFNTQMTSLSNMICKSGNWLVFLFLCA